MFNMPCPAINRPPNPVHLTLPAEPPTQAEIDAILVATNSIMGDAGRAGVTLILNGSRSQKARRHEWDKLPEYGALSHLTAVTIGQKIDWCIRHGWLRYEYTRDGIPLLFHTETGWERVQALWVRRSLEWFVAWQAAGTPEQVWPRLETINHEIKYLLLERLCDPPQPELAPVLYAWFPHEVRKVRAAINHTLQRWGLRPLSIHPASTTSL
ncbi:MAG TPA: RQC domain-containing protein [Chloroflexota bacterium]|nr:RQC domain-containing protein [Chloroflexota bacterium]HUM69761.1 RQC domain-containing protein [Chloroflexota bacterium]